MSLREPQNSLEDETENGVIVDKRAIIEMPDYSVDDREIGGGQEVSKDYSVRRFSNLKVLAKHPRGASFE